MDKDLRKILNGAHVVPILDFVPVVTGSGVSVDCSQCPNHGISIPEKNAWAAACKIDRKVNAHYRQVKNCPLMNGGICKKGAKMVVNPCGKPAPHEYTATDPCGACRRKAGECPNGSPATCGRWINAHKPVA